MMASNPLVSIIITTYYRNNTLGRAIRSAKSQTYEPIEIIVVDDSGDKHAKEVVTDFDVDYVPMEKNEGQMSAWNRGIDHCRGDYIQFLDDDDKIVASKIEKQIEVLQTEDDVGVVYCGFQRESGNISHPSLRGWILEEVLTLATSPCITSTMLMRQETLREIAPLPIYPAATDDVLKIELAKKTNFDYVDEPLVIRGDGEDSVSGSMKKINAWWQIISNYSELYDQYPNSHRKALSHIHYSKGKNYLKNNFFSIRARVLLLYSILESPDIDRYKIATLLHSIGGRYAVEFGKRVEDLFTRLR
jgi:glycosyltransferase involved in cell wall biosynthesis